MRALAAQLGRISSFKNPEKIFLGKSANGWQHSTPWLIYHSAHVTSVGGSLSARRRIAHSQAEGQNPPTDVTLDPGLYVVGTPIGCLEDITFRALRVLRTADKILSEDTRRTSILLKHYDISAHVESYHLYNEHGKLQRVGARFRVQLSLCPPCL